MRIVAPGNFEIVYRIYTQGAKRDPTCPERTQKVFN